MAGVFGVACETGAPGLADLLAKMAGRLRHHPWYRECRHVDEAEGVGLGRVTLGLLNTAAQPAATEDRGLLAVLEGEVLDYAEHRRPATASAATATPSCSLTGSRAKGRPSSAG
jgi:hypothetical protein